MSIRPNSYFLLSWFSSVTIFLQILGLGLTGYINNVRLCNTPHVQDYFSCCDRQACFNHELRSLYCIFALTYIVGCISRLSCASFVRARY